MCVKFLSEYRVRARPGSDSFPWSLHDTHMEERTGTGHAFLAYQSAQAPHVTRPLRGQATPAPAYIAAFRAAVKVWASMILSLALS